MILLVGSTSSGKTLFAKQLQEYVTKGSVLPESDILTTIPTVGTNMSTLQISRKDAVDIRELGGSMAPIWRKYYKNADSVVFLVDKSNPQQLSAASILLFDMLTDHLLTDVPFLVVWNKIDSRNCMSSGYIKNILDLDLIKNYASQKIDSVECSSVTGEGFGSIVTWLKQL
ncbi:ARL16 [Bugula neritina]|uniref:ARL16 n=1 Tax=Bugula neritina TaxID=10212 RepID=A0A7J7KMS1_BUGNE|nr:ARL16 [Bugula neritina]